MSKKQKKNYPEQNRRIVCFGGGNAIPKAVLIGLRKYPVEIFTIASMLESGGSSSQFRTDFKTLPAGDVRRHLLALSCAPRWKKELFALRVGREIFNGGHKGHAFGNVFISGLEYITKDFKNTLEIVHKFLEVKGQVLPATIEYGHIYAILENGETIFGEDEIDVPLKHDPKLKIKDIFLTRKIKGYSPTLNVIEKADLIIIGPGDLYSSLLPCFLPAGITEVLQKSKAKKVLIVNAMNKLGETNNFSVLDFTNEVEKYINCELDYVIYNNFTPLENRIKHYKKEHQELLDLVKINANLPKKKFIGKNLLVKSGPIEYDPEKVVKILLSL